LILRTGSGSRKYADLAEFVENAHVKTLKIKKTLDPDVL